jgi:predicted SprT family Zn-dependent metalloprotease
MPKRKLARSNNGAVATRDPGVVSYQTEKQNRRRIADDPTLLAYAGLKTAYVIFNRVLFNDRLPGCLITLQRKKGSYGYFSADQFARMGDSGERADEIALNPANFAGRTPAEILSVLVHEMVHLWQHYFGKPSRGRYHNAEWAAAMEAVGLIPSHTGKPGGRKTGQKVTHYGEEGGRFEKACAEVLAGTGDFLFQDLVSEGCDHRTRGVNKTRYTCRGCGLNLWGRPDANVGCLDCKEVMETAD